MKKLFFYGTLCHRPLLDFVLGAATSATISPARLIDHAVYWVENHSFPMIVAQSGAVAEGVLVQGLSEADIARLDFYEGGFDYSLRTLDVRTDEGDIAADVYFPREGLWTAGAPWSLQDWTSEWGALTMRAAVEVMGYYGHRSAADVARMFPMIRARAASWLAARAHPAREGAFGLADVEVAQHRRVHVNFFATDEYELRHRTFAGPVSEPISRTAFIGADATIVLPYDAARDRVLLVEQFRMGPFARGDRDCWMLEAVAGLVDAGETPEQTAHRETHEEAGITLRHLEPIGASYPTPGAFSEFHYSFIGLCDLPDEHDGGGGLDCEGEDLRVHLVSFERLMEMVADGTVRNAPLVLCALWLAHKREQLRAGA